MTVESGQQEPVDVASIAVSPQEIAQFIEVHIEQVGQPLKSFEPRSMGWSETYNGWAHHRLSCKTNIQTGGFSISTSCGFPMQRIHSAHLLVAKSTIILQDPDPVLTLNSTHADPFQNLHTYVLLMTIAKSYLISLL